VDERLIVACWIVAGGIFLGGIGALFGGLAGYVARLHERSPGGFVGRRALRGIERGLQRKLSPRAAGFVIGAFDGASFLGAIGVVLGWLAGKAEWLSYGTTMVIFGALAVVAALAVVFGMAAYIFTRGGIVVFGTACIGGLAGIYVGAWMAETGGIVIGAWAGLLLGFAVGWIGRRGQPHSRRWKRINIESEEPEP
jgi:hypothetical protein